MDKDVKKLLRETENRMNPESNPILSRIRAYSGLNFRFSIFYKSFILIVIVIMSNGLYLGALQAFSSISLLFSTMYDINPSDIKFIVFMTLIYISFVMRRRNGIPVILRLHLELCRLLWSLDYHRHRREEEIYY